MNGQERRQRQQAERELQRLPDRDLLIQTAVEVKAICRSLDELRENGCSKYAGVQALAARQSEQILTLQAHDDDDQTGRRDRARLVVMIISVIVAIVSAGAAVIATVWTVTGGAQ